MARSDLKARLSVWDVRRPIRLEHQADINKVEDFIADSLSRQFHSGLLGADSMVERAYSPGGSDDGRLNILEYVRPKKFNGGFTNIVVEPISVNDIDEREHRSISGGSPFEPDSKLITSGLSQLLRIWYDAKSTGRPANRYTIVQLVAPHLKFYTYNHTINRISSDRITRRVTRPLLRNGDEDLFARIHEEAVQTAEGIAKKSLYRPEPRT